MVKLLKGRTLFSLLFGAANQGEPRSGLTTGFHLGDLICAETQEDAKGRLRKEVKRNAIVALKSGVDPTMPRNALVGRLR